MTQNQTAQQIRRNELRPYTYQAGCLRWLEPLTLPGG